MSQFATLNTAVTALLAHRKALDVVGHNVANAATEGFSRRRVELTPIGSGAVPGIFFRSDRQGGGVDIEAVLRVRDEFLEARALREHGLSARLTAEAQVLARVEAALPEPSDDGLGAQLAQFWAAWDDVANTPASIAARVALLERAGGLADTFRRVDAELRTVRAASVDEMRTIVAQANATAARVAELNGRIAEATAAGLDPHDLADQRDLLIRELGAALGVEVRSGEFGTVDVVLSGSTLVSGTTVHELEVVTTGTLPAPLNSTGLIPAVVRWKIDGTPVPVTSGRVAGLQHAANTDIPSAIVDLDGVVSSLVTTVNAIHLTGQDLNGLAGTAFFTAGGLTAQTISVSATVAGQPANIAAAALGSGVQDGSVAQQLAALATAPNGPDAIYQEVVGKLAVRTQTANRRDEIQRGVNRRADDARLATSGVNLDEELASMVQYQRAYEAAARVLTTVDEMLDVLINRTGVVGR